jgi:hypothetical protein
MDNNEREELRQIIRGYKQQLKKMNNKYQSLYRETEKNKLLYNNVNKIFYKKFNEEDRQGYFMMNVKILKNPSGEIKRIPSGDGCILCKQDVYFALSDEQIKQTFWLIIWLFITDNKWSRYLLKITKRETK